jgi:hypothetical protein
MNQQGSLDRQYAALLRAWHLAVLRLALTRDNADRLGVFAIANEIDRLGRQHQPGAGFSFFRRTSKELCAAIVQPGNGNDVVLSRYLAQIDDARLHRVLAAALEAPQQKPDPTRSLIRPHHDLWRGLPSRSNPQP